MTTSALRLEMLIGGRVGARSAARPISQGIAAHESPTPSEPNVMNPFARRPLGVPLARGELVGMLVMYAVVALVIAYVLVR
jgi:hypothetical protein